MTRTARTVNRSATRRLAQIIEAEIARHELTTEEIAREARLPSKAFRSLLRGGHRPSLDRADELLRAVGTSMTIGVTPTHAGSKRDDETKHR